MLRWGKANLEAGVLHLLNSMGAQAQVAPRFQQAESDVLGRAHTGWEGLRSTASEAVAKQAALLDQLGEQVGNLQQKVENLTGDRIGGVRVFQVEPPIFER